MEFFEFDNSFISDKGSTKSSLGGAIGKGFDYGGKYKMSCTEVRNYKSGNFKMSSKAEHDAMQQYCIDNMPYQRKSDDANNSNNIDIINKF